MAQGNGNQYDPKNVIVVIDNELVPESDFAEFITVNSAGTLASVSGGITGFDFQHTYEFDETVEMTLRQRKFAFSLRDKAVQRKKFNFYIKDKNTNRGYVGEAMIQTSGGVELGNSESGISFTILTPGISEAGF